MSATFPESDDPVVTPAKVRFAPGTGGICPETGILVENVDRPTVLTDEVGVSADDQPGDVEKAAACLVRAAWFGVTGPDGSAPRMRSAVA